MTFQILTTGTPTFEYVLEPDNMCPTPATVRLFSQRRIDLAPFSLRSWNQKAERKACKGYWHWRGATRLASSRATASPYISQATLPAVPRRHRAAILEMFQQVLERDPTYALDTQMIVGMSEPLPIDPSSRRTKRRASELHQASRMFSFVTSQCRWNSRRAGRG